MPDERAKAKRCHPTAQEMDERIIAPEGATFEQVMESLVVTVPATKDDLKARSEDTVGKG